MHPERRDVQERLQASRILLAHTNTGVFLQGWHEARVAAAARLGYRVEVVAMAEYLPPVPFPHLDRLWRKRDVRLMSLYEALSRRLADCDVFIHFNGAMIHPQFLEQFKGLKIYHCADDPDSSAVLSRPVAAHYDVCAISNPACLEMYRAWGCRHVFFWPLGAFHYSERFDASIDAEHPRDVPIVFVGSKLGVPSIRFIGKYLGLYRKKRFMESVERAFPELVGYGVGWSNGHISDEDVPALYLRSRIGLNVHNSLGPINARLYDLAAFGVLQVCDNKGQLSKVFDEGREIIGFDSLRECRERLRYYLEHANEAGEIARAGRRRFRRDYTTTAIWQRFFNDLTEELTMLGRSREGQQGHGMTSLSGWLS